ncbi:MAG TPA: GNAT family N-acetyltransferase [Roseiflexaceae bacterium]|nr:GNAT family N-acetyltransferase [Roseiflexaceae bacterium]HMP41246.1 GNAT family N-acetyltransferase [Roseiflexaceae bacterium]
MTIELQGEYLELRPLPEQDLPALLKVYEGTPLYFDGLGQHSPLTLAAVRAQWQAAQDTPRRELLGVYHRVTDLLIGAADIQIGTPHPTSAAVWLLIWGGFQRQGYGQDCMALLEAWLIGGGHAETLCAIAAENAEGISFLELQGFQRTGEPATPPIGSGNAFWMCW